MAFINVFLKAMLIILNMKLVIQLLISGDIEINLEILMLIGTLLDLRNKKLLMQVLNLMIKKKQKYIKFVDLSMMVFLMQFIKLIKSFMKYNLLIMELIVIVLLNLSMLIILIENLEVKMLNNLILNVKLLMIFLILNQD